METKQSVIEKEWIALIGEDLFESVKTKIDENGYLEWGVCGMNVPISNLHTRKDNNKESYVRPISLRGIENNNGWIKIQSESDLPKERGRYFCLRAHSDYISDDYFDGDFINYHGYKVTYYQPITKPNPPLY